jgi:hypothetical protein
MARHPLLLRFIVARRAESASEGGWRAANDDDEQYCFAVAL